MDTILLDKKFARMGARLKIADRPGRGNGLVRLDVRSDNRGEFFEIARSVRALAEIDVLDVQPGERHLLLLVRDHGAKHKFLCGHDERHWFVAAIPERAPVGTVRQAREALKPIDVRNAQARHALNGKARQRRKNAAYVRQGEWFFIPAPGLVVDESLLLRNEPLSRGLGSKPHWAECCCRLGGQVVYVCGRYPRGVTENQYRKLLSRNAAARTWGWQTMRRNPAVFVRGRIRHTDHRTIVLREWHRVLMNTENQSAARRNVAFLD
jgi:hypothetical protein